jgi:hypothetical protein
MNNDDHVPAVQNDQPQHQDPGPPSLEEAVKHLLAKVSLLEQSQHYSEQKISTLQPTVPFHLTDEEHGFVPRHLQLPTLTGQERATILRKFPKPSIFPEALTDKNGLATLGINDGVKRSLITTTYPALQRNAMDLARMSLSAFHNLRNGDTFSHDGILEILRDITTVAMDNAQILAQKQLQLSLETRKFKAALSLSKNLDHSDTNIIQADHVNAISELNKFNKIVSPSKPFVPNRGGGSRGSRGGSRGRGYKRGSYRGRGRGFGGSKYQSPQQQSQPKTQQSDPQ